MGSFLAALQSDGTKTARTENGAVTHSTTTNAVLDFFALAGAKRHDLPGARTLFRKALAEDRQLAIRALFYLRDIRGGQGERDLFRFLFKDLIRIDLSAAEQVLKWVPEYGRWDDVISFYNFNGFNVTDLITGQFIEDIKNYEDGKSVSLMGKWLPSENASSANSRAKARQIASDLELSNREYRKATVKLRKRIGLLEQQMSNKEWSEIDYSKLPSQASRKHVKAFKRHDETRFEEFLGAVISGKQTMNAGTVATYEVLQTVRGGNDKAANAIWSSLPDYTNGSNALVVADTSGSMFSWGYGAAKGSSKPIDVSTSLALYFAEHNTGPFKDYFITFSERPELVKVIGKTLTEKLQNISTARWGMSTNIEAVFDLILKSAVAAGADAEDIPKVIYIISDMEFNSVRGGTNETNYEVAKRKFNAAGFELPHVVFWNVASRNENVPTTAAASNVTLVSGLSQSTFRYVLEGKTPVESMRDILNGERYQQIVVE
jgi:uncharacterized protein DUF2828